MRLETPDHLSGASPLDGGGAHRPRFEEPGIFEHVWRHLEMAVDGLRAARPELRRLECLHASLQVGGAAFVVRPEIEPPIEHHAEKLVTEVQSVPAEHAPHRDRQRVELV